MSGLPGRPDTLKRILKPSGRIMDRIAISAEVDLDATARIVLERVSLAFFARPICFVVSLRTSFDACVSAHRGKPILGNGSKP